MTQQQPATNEPSILLSDEENEMVFAALGARRIVSHLCGYLNA